MALECLGDGGDHAVLLASYLVDDTLDESDLDVLDVFAEDDFDEGGEERVVHARRKKADALDTVALHIHRWLFQVAQQHL